MKLDEACDFRGQIALARHGSLSVALQGGKKSLGDSKSSPVMQTRCKRYVRARHVTHDIT